MTFEIATWTLATLVKLHDDGHVDLAPPYQRNPVWTASSQQKLLESILLGKPIPNFFLRKMVSGAYEMIDGQQRARTIIGYHRGLIIDHESNTFSRRCQRSRNPERTRDEFLKYQISITIITHVEPTESIEEYYALLNSSGLRLSRPELKKAEYYTTTFLSLIMDCTEDSTLKSLRLFTPTTAARMNDFDFVSELLALLKFGISDKREKVDQLFEDDINQDEAQLLRQQFTKRIEAIGRCNETTPIIRTRYRQKNDFYSLFHLFGLLTESQPETIATFYNLLVKIGKYIRPSQVACEPFREYAFHCVTQSNSKGARQARHEILTALLLNRSAEPNSVQEQVLSFFELQPSDLRRVEGYFTIDPTRIHNPVYPELFDA